MKQEVETIEEAEAIVNPLMAEQKWAITVAQKAAGGFIVQWVEHKKYTAHDGQEFLDEVWTTEDGTMKLIQDLEPEHARNIIRMMLRNERKAGEQIDSLVQEMVAELEESILSEEDREWDEMEPLFPETVPNKSLH